uniref:Secreted protein n=1 Tax=Cynoglossus semilaevis TaxID=244447 RepID=A0A3P8W245_CYNSE
MLLLLLFFFFSIHTTLSGWYAFQHLYNGSLPKHVGSGNRVWSVLCCLAGWLARSHNRPLQPNPVASESTNQQTGDHTLPAPVVCARLSLIFLSAIKACLIDIFQCTFVGHCASL